jgi:hypothetical protein
MASTSDCCSAACRAKAVSGERGCEGPLDVFPVPEGLLFDLDFTQFSVVEVAARAFAYRSNLRKVSKEIHRRSAASAIGVLLQD